ncbi:hypothetical protein NQ317_009667 [Molorchus minor]|uniref:COMM domain-containing protein 2 n=1 Tax=Molorchus minor TaxID=1323400 RepID=A0ABQ9JJT1_9CUCU|nr:hypothetical protein NQ317_009667 [Molorchus minor]
MLISLRSDHKEHLELLTKQPIQVDFCKLAIDFLQNGPNLKRYTTAAQKLDVSVDVVQNCIYGLINLLLLSCRHKAILLSEADFRDSVLTLGFSEEQQAVLSKLYESKQNDIHLLNHKSLNEPHYDDLKWRFEVQVATRSLLHQFTPADNDGTSSENSKRTDPNNLLHIANELESALTESRSRHSRKIQRALRN